MANFCGKCDGQVSSLSIGCAAHPGEAIQTRIGVCSANGAHVFTDAALPTKCTYDGCNGTVTVKQHTAVTPRKIGLEPAYIG